MNANNAGKRRRTTIYATNHSNGAEQDYRESLNLLANILASYEDRIASCTQVLLASSGDQERNAEKPSQRSA